MNVELLPYRLSSTVSNDLDSDLRDLASGHRGKLRIATQCYTCYEWLPPLLKRFYRTHENVDVEIIADADQRAARRAETNGLSAAHIADS